MAEQNKTENKKETKQEEQKNVVETKPAEIPEEEKNEIKKSDNKDIKKKAEPNAKSQEKKETSKKTKPKKEKNEALVYGRSLPISTKHAIAICNFVRNKKIEHAIKDLQDVVNMKKAIPMKGEIPHRKGKIMSGRYPKKASLEFIKLLKGLNANASVNNINTNEDKVKINIAIANKASRPYRRFGRHQAKRSHVLLKVKIPKEKKEQNSQGGKIK